MITASRTGNAQANRDSYNSLNLFNKSTKPAFKEVTYSFLNKYEVFLRSRGGTDGGVSIRLRALYNLRLKEIWQSQNYISSKHTKISKLKGKSFGNGRGY
ncbi:MAG: integrase/recombinase XerD [Maribacter sp.]|jgi:integrase/recombinase XerD